MNICSLILTDFLKSSMFGVIIGFLLSELVSYFKRHRERNRKLERTKDTIHLELSRIWDRLNTQTSEWREQYRQTIGSAGHRSEHTFYFSIEEDYFVGFHSLVSEIAMLENKSLSEEIFKVYMKLKILADTIRLNNRALDTFDRASDLGEKYESRYSTLKSIGTSIFDQLDEIEGMVNQLISRLE